MAALRRSLLSPVLSTTDQNRPNYLSSVFDLSNFILIVSLEFHKFVLDWLVLGV